MSLEPIRAALQPGGALHPMAAFKQFCVYEIRPKADSPGKTDKQPVIPRSWQDTDALLTAEQALGAAGEWVGAYPVGVGFVFADTDPFFFLDGDGCYSPETGWSPVAVELIQALPGAAFEVSSSCRGFHLFGTGAPPEHGCRNGEHRLELYTRGRFAALTGMSAQGSAAAMLGEQMAGVVAKYFPPSAGGREAVNWLDEAVEGYGGPVDDDELIAKMLASGAGNMAARAFGGAGGASFRQVWEGDEDALGAAFPPTNSNDAFDRSAADMSLAQRLAFWTGRNPVRMERLMRLSALEREKWDNHATYLTNTIEKACAREGDIYTGKAPAAPVAPPAWTSESQNGQPAIAPTEHLPQLLVTNTEFAQAWAGPIADVVGRVAVATGGNCDATLAMLSMHAQYPGRTPELEAAIVQACGLLALGTDRLQLPLAEPLTVFHPRQVEYRVTKEGEFLFKAAKGTSENLERLCAAYGLQFRYNELAHAVELFIDGKPLTGDLAKNVQISLVENICRINEYPAAQVLGNIDAVAAKNAYNPAADWIRSKPWDGVPRVEQLFRTVTLDPEQCPAFAFKLFRKWLIGAAAILTGVTDKFEFVLTLVDPMGGLGKTRWANKLCPKDFMADGLTLDTRDKDSVLQATSKWIVELGELDSTFKRSDISALKAFLSRAFDEIRPAYARAANQYRRRTAFMGSVNQVKFLVDDTNNRRFWPILVSAVDYEHTIDMQQLWAEVLGLVAAGESWYLDAVDNKRIGEANKAFRAADPIEEMLEMAYDAAAPITRELTATEVAREIGLGNVTAMGARKIGTHLRTMGVEHHIVKGLTRYKLPVKT